MEGDGDDGDSGGNVDACTEPGVDVTIDGSAAQDDVPDDADDDGGGGGGWDDRGSRDVDDDGWEAGLADGRWRRDDRQSGLVSSRRSKSLSSSPTCQKRRKQFLILYMP